MTDAIKMSNLSIGHFLVLEQAPSSGRRAMWWVICTDCAHQFTVGGTNLRKAARGVWRVCCPCCERDE